ncbi:MAG: 23S rRNA (adenine(2503)-C(2))-methyltransferase RlmN [Clostridia bacterium]|nr:23S rRNA (adenine(2503)-C(2))-methyltransferase RlmN [Clostridia bacterium]
MKILQDLSLSELESVLDEWGEPKYRAKQIFENIYLGKKIEEITNIPKSLKQKLEEEFVDEPIKIYQVQTDKDGTQKFAYSLFDDNIIEGVLMKYKYGNTLCVSTQVGCSMGCKFCASSLNGRVRNLSAGEILSQVLVVNKLLGGTVKKREITNLVLMGSGEPLDNYSNVTKFLKLVTSKDGINISARNISLSTCGIVPNIKNLSNLGLPIILTISLHAPNDEIRKKIMPIANKYKISEIISASKNYFNKTGRRVIFEYALISDVNDSKECAKELAFLLKGFPTHINLIPLNEVEERKLKTVSRKKAEEFLAVLKKYGASATIRRTIGENIDGACGQLRNKILKENNKKN